MIQTTATGDRTTLPGNQIIPTLPKEVTAPLDTLRTRISERNGNDPTLMPFIDEATAIISGLRQKLLAAEQEILELRELNEQLQQRLRSGV